MKTIYISKNIWDNYSARENNSKGKTIVDGTLDTVVNYCLRHSKCAVIDFVGPMADEAKERCAGDDCVIIN